MDISKYGNSELSDMVDNDEYLYKVALFANDFEDLKHAVVECLVFNDDQLLELKQDYQDGRWS